MNVLGIGDCPYDDLRPELQESLQEYYKVDSLENYDEVYGAVGYFIWHYGRIDWLESNNEYWLGAGCPSAYRFQYSERFS